MVQDFCHLGGRWLEALVRSEIRGGLGLNWFKIADNVFVTSEELLLDIPGVDHGWSLNRFIELHLPGRIVSMPWPYLEILHFRCKVTLGASSGVGYHFCLWVVLVPPNSVCMDAMQDFIKSWKRYVKLCVGGMVLLAGRDLGELALDVGVHIADCEENAACQLFLVVQSQPLGHQGDDVGFKDLRAGQFRERFLFKDREVLRCGWLRSKHLLVPRRCRHLAEYLVCNLWIWNVSIKVNLSIDYRWVVLIVSLFLETPRSLRLDDWLDEVQALNTIVEKQLEHVFSTIGQVSLRSVKTYLLIRFANHGSPFNELRYELRLYDFFNDLQFTVRKEISCYFWRINGRLACLSKKFCRS